MTKKKKIRLYDEPVYILAIMLLSLAVSFTAAADFGVSMIVGPAYILSLKVSFLTFGQAEYIIQGMLFIVLCAAMRRVRVSYFFSFVTCVLYGFVLDMWRRIIPALNPNVTAPGSFPLPVRIILFALGMVMTSFSIALFYKIYLCPQVYDFFVKAVSRRYGVPLSKFKTCFDFSCLFVALSMTLLLFHGIRGIGIGTLIMTCLNGTLIGVFCSLLDRFVEWTPLLPRVKQEFAKG